MLPPTWSRANPIDIIGDAPVQRYTDTLQALLADRDSGAVLFMHAPTAIVRSDDIARACAPLVRQATGRVMACWLGDAAVADARRIFEDAGVADYATPEEAVRAFAHAAHLPPQPGAAASRRRPRARTAPPDMRCGARASSTRALADGREMLDELEAKAVLQAYGIPVVRDGRRRRRRPMPRRPRRATIGYPVGAEDPVARHQPQVRRRRRRA